jgi:hypothetical protein
MDLFDILKAKAGCVPDDLAALIWKKQNTPQPFTGTVYQCTDGKVYKCKNGKIYALKEDTNNG